MAFGHTTPPKNPCWGHPCVLPRLSCVTVCYHVLPLLPCVTMCCHVLPWLPRVTICPCFVSCCCLLTHLQQTSASGHFKVKDSFRFNANRLVITNVDIQSVEPVDQRTRDSLQKSVQLAIEITTNSQEASARWVPVNNQSELISVTRLVISQSGNSIS